MTEGQVEYYRNGELLKMENWSSDGYPESVIPEIDYFTKLFYSKREEAEKTLKRKYNTDYLYRIDIGKETIEVDIYFITFKGEMKYQQTVRYKKSKKGIEKTTENAKQYMKDNQIKEKIRKEII